MAKVILNPTRIQAQGTPPKTIEEYVGRVNTGQPGVSIARMISPSGWSEPGQTPDFSDTRCSCSWVGFFEAVK
jgi:hypothetical protein